MRIIATWALMLYGFAIILLGFTVIECCDTTLIADMSERDWILAMTGSVLCFGGLFHVLVAVCKK